jgi:hypothetical protein
MDSHSVHFEKTAAIALAFRLLNVYNCSLVAYALQIFDKLLLRSDSISPRSIAGAVSPAHLRGLLCTNEHYCSAAHLLVFSQSDEDQLNVKAVGTAQFQLL